jgi:dipeptidyl aminopeptidase/acylaminoacyl peptidase
MCILGPEDFGGYLALLGATRNRDLYRCVVSIAGISDLSLMQGEKRGNQFALGAIAADREKLRNESPLRHVDEIDMPVLLVHGDRDLYIDIEQSRSMEAALKRADKNVKAVYIEGATHQLDRKSDRVTLLSEIEKFLHDNLGPGVATGG